MPQPLVVLAPGATVTIYEAGTLIGATIYADNLSPPTPLGNPFIADSTGFWFFYAPAGRYDVRFSGAGVLPYTLGDITLGGGSDVLASLGFQPTKVLGGSRSQGLQSSVPVPLVDYVDQEIDWDKVNNTGLTVRLRGWLRTADVGTSVALRLYNLSETVNVLDSPTAIALVDEDFVPIPITGETGKKVYRGFLVPQNANVEVFGGAELELSLV